MELMALLATLALWDRPAPREPLEQPALMVALVWMVLWGMLAETANLVLLVPLALLAHRGEMEQTELTVPLGAMVHQRSSARNP